MTKEEAIAALHRDTLHHKTLKASDGEPVRCRVNGQCKTWKTRQDEFKLPVKYGLFQCFYITQDNANEWSITCT